MPFFENGHSTIINTTIKAMLTQEVKLSYGVKDTNVPRAINFEAQIYVFKKLYGTLTLQCYPLPTIES